MNEEIMAAVGTIAYWRQRYDAAEAGAAMLRRAVEACEAMIEWDDPSFPAAARRLRAEIDTALGQNAGATILAELAAGQTLADAAQAALNAPLFEHRTALESALAAYRAAQRRS
jgi:hypothetical protein